MPGAEKREAALCIYARGDDLLALIGGDHPCGFVFTPWPWAALDRTKAPQFARTYPPDAVGVFEQAVTQPAERCEVIPWRDAWRWTFAPNIDDMGGLIFGRAFDRGLLRDAMAALIAAGVRQDGNVRVELITIPVLGYGSLAPQPHKAIRLTQWLATAVLMELRPGVETEGSTLVGDLS